MSAAAVAGEAPKAKGGRKKTLLIALPVLVAGAGAGLWFSGVLPSLLGMGQAPAAAHAPAEPAGPRAPVFMDLPEMLTNLNVTGRRAQFVRVRAKLELSRAEDAAAVQAAMPRVMDLFQTYLREMRPEELRGSQGTHRLREELRNRASIAAHPARVLDVLFVEMVVQ